MISPYLGRFFFTSPSIARNRGTIVFLRKERRGLWLEKKGKDTEKICGVYRERESGSHCNSSSITSFSHDHGKVSSSPKKKRSSGAKISQMQRKAISGGGRNCCYSHDFLYQLCIREFFSHGRTGNVQRGFTWPRSTMGDGVSERRARKPPGVWPGRVFHFSWLLDGILHFWTTWITVDGSL